MLELCDVCTPCEATQALWDVCLEVRESEIVALIGSNGAGKTALLDAISGIAPPVSGTIEFLGKRIDGLPSHVIVDLGISHVPEGGRVFPDMTVYENLEMGAYSLRAWQKKEETLKQVYQIFPILEERTGQLASTLSGGERQMLAIARGLMSRPKLCMLDEPSYGLAPLMVEEIFRVIQDMRAQGITILLVEQNVRHSLETADRAYVMENGRICMEGTGEDLLESDFVRQAFLGL
ncbi:MAG: ABC transporter ATP-binding protein [Anaerolineales bacterium]